MNDQHNDPLENELAALTAWEGSAPQVWRKALGAIEPAKSRPKLSLSTVLNWQLRHVLAACVGLFLISAVAVSLITRSETGRTGARAVRIADPSSSHLKSLGVAQQSISADWNDRSFQIVNDDPSRVQPARTTQIDGAVGGAQLFSHPFGTAGSPNSAFFPLPLSGTTNAIPTNGNPTTAKSGLDRQVIRKATIELTTDDVRAAFLKAMHVVSEAGGEYVQDSALTGTGKDAQGNLTIRVRADRLPAVLDELRTFGTVRAENATGEDVTSMVVDLEARIRNEQRVEQELLELFDKRADAPLKEVLELRDRIGQVREQVERYIAQREHLSRLVSLATILVIIRTDAKPEPPAVKKDQGIGEYFATAVSGSWIRGLRFLVDTVSGAVGVLIGGLFWWGLAVAALVAARQLARRKAATSAHQS